MVLAANDVDKLSQAAAEGLGRVGVLLGGLTLIIVSSPNSPAAGRRPDAPSKRKWKSTLELVDLTCVRPHAAFEVGSQRHTIVANSFSRAPPL